MGTSQWAIDLYAVESGIGSVVDESLVVSHENGRAKPTKVLTLASSVALALDVRTRTECTTQHRPTCLFQLLMSQSHFQQHRTVVWRKAMSVIAARLTVGDCGLALEVDTRAVVALLIVWSFQEEIAWWMRQLACRRQFQDEVTMTKAAVPFDTTSDQTVNRQTQNFGRHNLPSLPWYSDQGANDKNGHTFLNMRTALLKTVAMVARGITGGIRETALFTEKLWSS